MDCLRRQIFSSLNSMHTVKLCMHHINNPRGLPCAALGEKVGSREPGDASRGSFRSLLASPSFAVEDTPESCNFLSTRSLLPLRFSLSALLASVAITFFLSHAFRVVPPALLDLHVVLAMPCARRARHIHICPLSLPSCSARPADVAKCPAYLSPFLATLPLLRDLPGLSVVRIWPAVRLLLFYLPPADRSHVIVSVDSSFVPRT
jgi:hypothetical protein